MSTNENYYQFNNSNYSSFTTGSYGSTFGNYGCCGGLGTGYNYSYDSGLCGSLFGGLFGGYGSSYGCGCYNAYNMSFWNVGNSLMNAGYSLGMSGLNFLAGASNMLFAKAEMNSAQGKIATAENAQNELDQALGQLGQNASIENYKTAYGTDAHSTKLKELETAKTTANTNLDTAKASLKSKEDTLSATREEFAKLSTDDANYETKKNELKILEEQVTALNKNVTEAEKKLQLAEAEYNKLNEKCKKEDTIIASIDKLVKNNNAAQLAAIKKVGANNGRNLTYTISKKLDGETLTTNGDRTRADFTTALTQFANSQTQDNQNLVIAIYNDLPQRLKDNPKIKETYEMVLHGKVNTNGESSKCTFGITESV